MTSETFKSGGNDFKLTVFPVLAAAAFGGVALKFSGLT